MMANNNGFEELFKSYDLEQYFKGYIKLLNIDSIYQNKIDEIIESFVSFYGEERRNEITKKLKSVTFVPYTNIMSIMSIFNKMDDLLKETKDLDVTKYYSEISLMNDILKKYKENETFYMEKFNNPQTIEELKKMNLLIPMNESILNNVTLFEQTGLFMNAKEDNNEFEAVPIVFFNINADIENIDSLIFHELNHVIETEVINIDKNNIEYITGFSISETKIDDNNRTNNIKNEYLNEIINDIISQEICRSFHSNGNCIVSDPSIAKYDSTKYLNMLPIVEDFINIFHDEILANRNNGLDQFMKKVGEENFIEYSNLVNEYFEFFKDEKYYYVILEKFKEASTNEDNYKEIIDSINTVSSDPIETAELIKKYDDYVEKSKIIVSRMKEYYDKQKKTM